MEEETRISVPPSITSNLIQQTPGPSLISNQASPYINPMLDDSQKKITIETLSSVATAVNNKPNTMMRIPPNNSNSNSAGLPKDNQFKGDTTNFTSPVMMNLNVDSGKKSSVLDPNDELKSISNNIEEIRKNTLEIIENKRGDKTQTTGYAFNKPPASQLQIPAASSINNLNNLETKKFSIGGINVDNTQKDLIGSTSGRKIGTEIDSFANASKTALDKLDQKNDAFTKSAQLNANFSEAQREFLNDCFLDIKNYFSDTVQNLHLEMIRQFQIQQNELNLILEKNLMQFANLYEKYEELKKENDRLKKTSF